MQERYHLHIPTKTAVHVGARASAVPSRLPDNYAPRGATAMMAAGLLVATPYRRGILLRISAGMAKPMPYRQPAPRPQARASGSSSSGELWGRSSSQAKWCPCGDGRPRPSGRAKLGSIPLVLVTACPKKPARSHGTPSLERVQHRARSCASSARNPSSNLYRHG
jgi:hypothetical protein